MLYCNDTTTYSSNTSIFFDGTESSIPVPPPNEAPVLRFKFPNTTNVSTKFWTSIEVEDTDLKVIRLFLDGKQLRKSTSSPLNKYIRTRRGKHTLRAVAVDEAGNKTIEILEVIAS